MYSDTETPVLKEWMDRSKEITEMIEISKPMISLALLNLLLVEFSVWLLK